jgi:large subunit ribosomal protein L23
LVKILKFVIKMARKNIIIKPILSEKTTALAGDPLLNQYTFQVVKKSNKLEIRKAIEEQFGVTVLSVNTSIRPGKSRSRVVKGRQTKGQTSPIKKAIVTIAEGESIDGFYGNDMLDEIEILDDATTEANA